MLHMINPLNRYEVKHTDGNTVQPAAKTKNMTRQSDRTETERYWQMEEPNL